MLTLLLILVLSLFYFAVVLWVAKLILNGLFVFQSQAEVVIRERRPRRRQSSRW